VISTSPQSDMLTLHCIEYHGDLVSVDGYMNIQLRNTEEYIAGKSKGVLGEVLIRCNNVLWISAADGKSSDEDTGMSG
jgi:small nuclear ribonucleoprotein F